MTNQFIRRDANAFIGLDLSSLSIAQHWRSQTQVSSQHQKATHHPLVGIGMPVNACCFSSFLELFWLAH
jgi:hypothetical protein